MAYDPSTESIVMFGGEDNDGVTGLNDLWYFFLKNKTWTTRTVSNVPKGRIGAGAVVTTNNTLLVFGGVTGWSPNDTVVNEMWMLEAASEFNSGSSLHASILLSIFVLVCAAFL
eukprot:Phypoly_transcript_16906.p2 GENE.Phypoly_transcript_16906~~Phypoly_transcript_16906.p2  ORF type:complete len:114 (+),score=21.36 Phypoly_transcript_16906:481-822(+)